MRNKKDDKLATCMMALCCLPRVDCGICLLLVLLLLLLLVPHVVASDCKEAKPRDAITPSWNFNRANFNAKMRSGSLSLFFFAPAIKLPNEV